jgi:hypothetical protein
MFFDANQTLEALNATERYRPLPPATSGTERAIVALAVIWAGKKILGK